ncbi:hypothetical protein NIES3974_18750 [Calothrix sp. NIES-3974]|nr:hypothetical protein NIES3974_18750 [Calothrix sp. NIES-3974]
MGFVSFFNPLVKPEIRLSLCINLMFLLLLMSSNPDKSNLALIKVSSNGKLSQISLIIAITRDIGRYFDFAVVDVLPL